MKKIVTVYLFLLAFFGINGCREDQAPLPAENCLFQGKSPITDTSYFFDAFFRFRTGNQWNYTVNFYRADTIYQTQTQTSEITGLYIIDGNYWWSYNNSTQSVLMTASGNVWYDLYNQDGAGCPENHIAFTEAVTDTVFSNYTNGSGSTAYLCYFVPVNDTLIQGTDTFFPTVKKHSTLYNQPSYSYFAPQIGMVYSRLFYNMADSSAYSEVILNNYYIR